MPAGDKQIDIARRERLFSKVKEARELLKQEAENILRMYMETIKMAVAAGDFESALKAQQWLIDHMPNEEAVRMIDISVDKPVLTEGPKGPQIQIGIALGGMNMPKQIESSPVITVVPEED
jgi:hypothetical protein